jgi:hypothetical protein
LAAAPVIEKLKAQLAELSESRPVAYATAMEVYRVANLLTTSEGGDPCRVKTGALLIGVIRNEPDPMAAATQLLRSTILEEDEISAICELLRGILAGERPEHIDGSVVSDALILAETELVDESEQSRLLTEGAKMIYALRRKKKEEKQ